MTPEHEDPAMGWYNRFARHPYYGAMGSFVTLQTSAAMLTSEASNQRKSRTAVEYLADSIQAGVALWISS